MTKLIVAFRNFANVPKNVILIHSAFLLGCDDVSMGQRYQRFGTPCSFHLQDAFQSKAIFVRQKLRPALISVPEHAKLTAESGNGRVVLPQP